MSSLLPFTTMEVLSLNDWTISTCKIFLRSGEGVVGPNGVFVQFVCPHISSTDRSPIEELSFVVIVEITSGVICVVSCSTVGVSGANGELSH